ncbi:dephospho-CoA kinase [Phocaeicola faecicola]|jgi:dephospho-CoA kinase|uniref:dephospho-CoA kinase n=1 Tax=Phocaeicola faecicola TaxID=2739389 RepID=UPI0015B64FDB|nr:dephospho-CoA kinase [Phocaeicola faecicola]MCI5743927.1 dephospho-CoA kinase [Bacteroides sp.]MDD6909148.1 dephospho-CoA kinase [Bacteroidaceae bacterium]MDY4872101.1 dephospho-CoA kinase [Phocaeicola faecicola]
MIKLGITGGIGSGKSFVSRCLKEGFSVQVYDTDREAKRLMLEHEGIRADLIALLGEEVYTAAGLNKPLLAAYIFSSPENAQKVNAIVHPRVKEDFRNWAFRQEQAGGQLVGVESAILFESGFDREVDKTLTVSAPLELRITRVMERDRVGREQVLERITAQISDEERNRLSDFSVENAETSDIHAQLVRILSALNVRNED